MDENIYKQINCKISDIKQEHEMADILKNHQC